MIKSKCETILSQLVTEVDSCVIALSEENMRLHGIISKQRAVLEACERAKSKKEVQHLLDAHNVL